MRDVATLFSPSRLHAVLALALALAACRGEKNERAEKAAARPAPAPATSLEASLRKRQLSNVIAYIPPACFAKTRASGVEPARNPCYVCHGGSMAPNYNDDEDLQTTLTFPSAAADDPWKNLVAPAVLRAPKTTDDDVLRRVRANNYAAADGSPLLAKALASPPDEWDIDGDHAWGGYVPDAGLVFDDHGFDHRADGSETGWRAFAYFPFPGAFFPTNGSTDDVLIRLPRRFQTDDRGAVDRVVYEVNLAVVEALVTRADVPIDPVDESALGVDLDRDGALARAARVTFDADARSPETTRMQYVGEAGAEQRAGRLAIAPGLFPLGTEFFHTVRYLDVGGDGVVGMARRMKELRYAKKVAYLDYATLRGRAALDAREVLASRDGARHVNWLGERGIDNGQGWIFEGFIEAKDGALRPQSREETVYCAGCHGGIGATTDSIFSFPRKLGGEALARGWFHWSQHDLRGVPEPRTSDGAYEYTEYLARAGAGDDFGANAEVLARFFDDRHQPRPRELEALHADVTRLLLPSPARALDLDRAYMAVVDTQAFALGRDAVLAPAQDVYTTVPLGESTGIRAPVAVARLVRAERVARTRGTQK